MSLRGFASLAVVGVVTLAGTLGSAQEQRLDPKELDQMRPSESVCRPECNAAHAAWVQAFAALSTANEDLRLAINEMERAEERDAQTMKAVIDAVKNDTSTRNALDAASNARDNADIARRKAKRAVDDARRRFARAYDADLRASAAYRRCCDEGKSDDKGFPVVPVTIGTGIAAGVATVFKIADNDSPKPADRIRHDFTPPPSSGPTPPANPNLPPTPTGPITGTFVLIDPGLPRTYPVQFSGPNVDFSASTVMTLTATDCTPPFFFLQFNAEGRITGTGPFLPPSAPITGTGTATFTLAGEQVNGQLSLSIIGRVITVIERLTRNAARCFGEFRGMFQP